MSMICPIVSLMASDRTRVVWAEVVEGLEEHATVIYEPMNELEDGALVAEK